MLKSHGQGRQERHSKLNTNIYNIINNSIGNRVSKVVDLSMTKGTTKEILESYKKKQQFRVSVGKSKWFNYETFNPNYNLREILKDELVIEFDTDDKVKAMLGIRTTAQNLTNLKISFELWDHGGKCPHLHIHNLPIPKRIIDDKLSLRNFKKFLINKVVPEQFLDCVDYSLCGIHLVALEETYHWKKKYGVKKLCFIYNSKIEVCCKCNKEGRHPIGDKYYCKGCFLENQL